MFRRTDFYKIQDPERGFQEGYPPGYASKVAYNAFCKYNNIARDDDEKVRLEQPVLTRFFNSICSLNHEFEIFRYQWLSKTQLIHYSLEVQRTETWRRHGWRAGYRE